VVVNVPQAGSDEGAGSGSPPSIDDGAADHLLGMQVPKLVLPSTSGDVSIDRLAEGRLVLYVYPRTGRPGHPSPPGWDEIPGVRGCTSQSCGFRDHAEELAALGASVAGLSAQPIEEQLEFAQRNRMPYPVISDSELTLAERLQLPTFGFAGETLYKRLALIAEGGRIVKVFYPVLQPDRNALDVLDWLAGQPG
jgi:peroxiredoxin